MKPFFVLIAFLSFVVIDLVAEHVNGDLNLMLPSMQSSAGADREQPKPKDAYDKTSAIADIFSKVFLGLVGVWAGWVAHRYNKRQDAAENRSRQTEVKLHRIQTVQQFLPQLMSLRREEEWAALALISTMGDKDLALDVGTWYMARLLKQQDRDAIEKLKDDADPIIAELATKAWQKFIPKQVRVEPSETLESDYEWQTAPVDAPRSIVRFSDDPDEHHGDFVLTRGSHELTFSAGFKMGVYLVTNELFLEFVRDQAYMNDEYWDRVGRHKFFTQDMRTLGPAGWPSAGQIPKGLENHPVSGISFYEAQAFCRWFQAKHPPDRAWVWTLPTEDMWELAARSEAGFVYPWGNTFQLDRCNSSETGIGATAPVNKFAVGRSKYGCFDMAGNVWEYVEARDVEWWSCLLRGGSFRNNASEVASYLRLVRVPRDHRPPDFGFRLAQRAQ
jgi:hypothetical protein